MPASLPIPSWPNEADVAVSLTFDVDAEAGLLGEGEAEYAGRLTSLSEGRFGISRGLPRVLRLLNDFNIRASFYVPGDTVERHRDAIAEIIETGHEIGHHGYRHLRSDRINGDLQRAEIERGLEVLADRLGIRPCGYRSAAWELTPETLSLLCEYDFAFDSSCMGDDRPYFEVYGPHAILELPVHWSLDDWPYCGWTIDGGGNIMNPDDMLHAWLGEFVSAVADRRHVTYTMHPEVIGRGYRIAALRQFLESITGMARIWFATHSEVALLVREATNAA